MLLSKEAQRLIDNLETERNNGYTDVKTWGRLHEYPSVSELLEKAAELENQAKAIPSERHVLNAVAVTIRKEIANNANAERRKMLYDTANTTLNNTKIS